MILSTSFSNSFRHCLLFLALLLCAGCAVAERGARPATLAVTGTALPLRAEPGVATEPVEQLFEYHLSRDGRDLGSVHRGKEPVWEWTPQQPGEYRYRTVLRHPSGKVLAVSRWSDPYLVAEPLTVRLSGPDRPAPQTAGTALRWQAFSRGGAGAIVYGFEVQPEGAALQVAPMGPSPLLTWHPALAGSYRVRAVAVDALGNRAESGWSDPYQVAAPLALQAPSSDLPAPQLSGRAIRWKLEASGGVGEISYLFELRDDQKRPLPAHSGPGPEWLWTPAVPGGYQVRGVAVDALGNRAVSDWSERYPIALPPEARTPVADLPAPRAAGSSVRWSAAAEGGIGALSYQFELRPEGGAAQVVQSGSAAHWLWSPAQAGLYQVRMVAVDAAGNRGASDWSAPYRIVPAPQVQVPVAEQPAPQTAGTAIRWKTEASGGVGEISFDFKLRRGEGKVETVQSGPAPEWLWRPAEAGSYLVWVVARDAHGNRATSQWSVPFEVAPPLAVQTPVPDRPAPQVSGTALRWTTRASGGVGDIAYRFEWREGEGEAVALPVGPSPEWLWEPVQAKTYQVRAVAVDARGNRAESGWSAPYQIAAPVTVQPPQPDLPAPRTAGSPINWSTAGSGGVGELRYAFELRPEGGTESQVAAPGNAPSWLWHPAQAGRYQVRAVAVDTLGNRAASGWSLPYQIVPRLTVRPPRADRPQPQALGTAVLWQAEASGGVGEASYEFRLRRNEGKDLVVQSGKSSQWRWNPAEPGGYQVRVVVVDTQGNRAATAWSDPYQIVAQLVLRPPLAEPAAPQLVGTAITWRAETSGGVGSRSWSFFVQRDGDDVALLQEGGEPVLTWVPEEPGSYRIYAGARDSRGNTANSGWSEPYQILAKEVKILPEPETAPPPVVAVFPVEVLTGAGAASVKQMRQALQERLVQAGFTLLDDQKLEAFMTRHRIRYVGGVDSATSQALQEETGANAVLITSLDLNNEGDPPKLALFSRLIATGERPEILWMDGTGRSGDDNPGILDLGVVHDPAVLRNKAVAYLVDSLVARLSEEKGRSGAGKRLKRFRPKIAFDAEMLRKGKRYTIGVLPFINVSERNNAGELLALQFVRQLSELDEFNVLEPGMVREKLLNLRIIMAEGISKADLDVISNTLEADLMLTGKVSAYQDLNTPGGVPKVEFSVLLMEREGKKIVWSSTSYNTGSDGVFFFDAGRISTSMETASKMVRSILAQMEKRSDAPGPPALDLLEQFRGKK